MPVGYIPLTDGKFPDRAACQYPDHQSGGETIAAVCYGTRLVVLGVLFKLIRMHAPLNHRLVHADTAPDVVRTMGARLLTGSALCGVITLVAPIQVDPGPAGYLLVLLYDGVTGIRRAE